MYTQGALIKGNKNSSVVKGRQETIWRATAKYLKSMVVFSYIYLNYTSIFAMISHVLNIIYL